MTEIFEVMEMLLALLQAAKVSGLVFAMMVLTDIVNVATKGAPARILAGKGWRQYLLASFLGATPGCLGAFIVVYLYAHGALGLGALVACLVATSGDEAFAMLAQFPLRALLIFFLLFLAGVASGWLTDKIASCLRIRPSEACLIGPPCEVCIQPVGSGGFSLWGRRAGHFLGKHLWEHIVKKHLWRVFLWTFVAFLIVNQVESHLGWREFVESHLGIVFVLAVLIGLIPESGPHMVFVTFYAQGLIPLPVLFVNSMLQEGHALLPLLAFSPRDAVIAKLFKLIPAGILGLFFLLGGKGALALSWWTE